MTSSLKAVSSKWIKTRIMIRNVKLRQYVPTTHPFDRSRLSSMLAQHNMLYVKPDIGSLGIGVMRVEKRGGTYRYQSGVNIYRFPTFERMYQSLQRRCGTKRYLIQKGIYVLTHEGSPYDFRVMVQRAPSGKWVCTGTAARVAHPQKAVTNGSQGGTIYSPYDLLEPRFGVDATSILMFKMEKIAYWTSAQLSRTYPGMNELGIDIAVDQGLKPWILEVNTRPDPCPFTKLEDKSIIRRIVRLGRANGRKYDLTCSKAKKAPKGRLSTTSVNQPFQNVEPPIEPFSEPPSENK
ncbi:YheC/YheD family protein [Paenibacillus qinlingensis]|uniref:Glutathione synthase/RimK-type ligase-like ATP-grasp enzyme n=1 Tax=Paenibacillus qinlingensis TaxID=1837343 RepID=A0ABU1P6I2_9BACL|nr:YheC/YheD family protein [Paenibacillus qinlingensis]MDR6554777.1 glutathione synthase/RimK-type ligase-like ATP-grasp enzyme [Paenibacillus qinlingensis]